MAGDLEQIVGTLTQILAILGLLLAIGVLLGFVVGIMRSVWRVARRNDTLVLPFEGDSGAVAVNRVLCDQLTFVEARVRSILGERLQQEPQEEPGARSRTLDAGPLSRPLPEFDAKYLHTRDVETFITDPNVNRPVGAITIAGFSLSPDSLFALSYLVRSYVARRTIRGSCHTFGDTVRLAATIQSSEPPSGSPHALDGPAGTGRRGRRPPAPMVVPPLSGPPGSLLTMIDDLAFRFVKIRLGLGAGTERWSAYQAFAKAYSHHLEFLRTGDTMDRDSAAAWYRQAVEADPDYGRAHYNYASLLYDRYTVEANAEAIEHYRRAASSSDADAKALGYAGLTMAYCQNIHRYALEPRSEWLVRASGASKRARQLRDVPETRFARAWFLQVSERYDEAIAAYRAVASATDRDDVTAIQVASFALNNTGWILMDRLGDPEAARESLEQALGLRPNKMIYANLGELSRRGGEFLSAIQCYEAALDLDPLYVNGLNELGIVYLSCAAGASSDGQPSARRANIERAYSYHSEALSLVAEPEQQDRLADRFDQARRASGLGDDEVRTEAQRARAYRRDP